MWRERCTKETNNGRIRGEGMQNYFNSISCTFPKRHALQRRLLSSPSALLRASRPSGFGASWRINWIMNEKQVRDGWRTCGDERGRLGHDEQRIGTASQWNQLRRFKGVSARVTIQHPSNTSRQPPPLTRDRFENNNNKHTTATCQQSLKITRVTL